jgi:fructan beta-fructosidase
MERVLFTMAQGVLLCVALFAPGVHAADDIVIADFEGGRYGGWGVEGEAFGGAPANGTLPGQTPVSGYEGEGLANSFVGGDKSTGKLTSPEFKIERKFINFLIGGGAHRQKAAINLILLRGARPQAVRTATGPNSSPKGTGAMEWESWDVSGFKGLDAQIEIVDNVTGMWGHITIDTIVLSDRRFAAPRENFTREIEIAQDYLHFPVKNGGPTRLVRLKREDELLREFMIEYAVGEPDFWVYLETHDFRGETLALTTQQIRGDIDNLLDRVSAGNTPKNFDTYYAEEHRPQFHFTTPRGWNNDPNGMVYYKGEYHLFYQRNPFGWGWGNMTWGHAVSKDMLHWTHLPDALHPDDTGTMYSGTAVVDTENTAGLKTGEEDPIVLFYTSAGGNNPSSRGVRFTQSLAYSNDRGRTWTKYGANPIVKHIQGGNRDPKVLWHEPTQQWAMVLYLDQQELGFFTSSDLKEWTEQSRLKGFHECPELFELALDGDEANKRWVLYGAAGSYLIGHFDGKVFEAETELIKYNYGDAFYASQTFSDIPAEDGRRIQIAWGRISTPGMPFNQMMDFPVTLSLRTTPDGIRMCPMPVKEIKALYKSERTFTQEKVEPGSNLLSEFAGDLFDIEADIILAEADRVGFRIRGMEIAYDAREKELKCGKNVAGLMGDNRRIRLRILVDKTSIEVFANDGQVYMPLASVPRDGQERGLEFFAEGGAAQVDSLAIRELDSVWN